MKLNVRPKLFHLGLLGPVMLLPVAANAQVSFAPPSFYDGGDAPQSVVAADVNGDGKMDLICVNSTSSGTLSVLTNNGSGGFGSNATYNVGSWPTTVTAADINGDGKVDLICANGQDGTIMVLTNDGSGSFTISSTNSAGNYPWGIAVADFNRDGKMDFVCANEEENSLSVFTNDGSGGFALASTLAMGGPIGGVQIGTYSVVAADINGDGWVDLVAATYGRSKLFIFTNDESGGFALSSTISVGQPISLTAADVNGDGKMDLICTDYGAFTLTVLTNNGSGNFATSGVYDVGSYPNWVTAADVNGDGKVDLICANSAIDNTFSVFTNTGTGGFALAATLPTGLYDGSYASIATADLNGDGRLDLIFGAYEGSNVAVYTNMATYLPLLTLQHSSDKFVVSWPSQWTGWAGWTLQQTTNLNTPNWTGFSGTMGDDGTTKSVTNSSTAGNIFFRLSHP